MLCDPINWQVLSGLTLELVELGNTRDKKERERERQVVVRSGNEFSSGYKTRHGWTKTEEYRLPKLGSSSHNFVPGCFLFLNEHKGEP